MSNNKILTSCLELNKNKQNIIPLKQVNKNTILPLHYVNNKSNILPINKSNTNTELVSIKIIGSPIIGASAPNMKCVLLNDFVL